MNTPKLRAVGVMLCTGLLTMGCGSKPQDVKGASTQTSRPDEHSSTSSKIHSQVSVKAYPLSRDPKSAALFRGNHFGAVAQVRSVEEPSIPKLPEAVTNPEHSGEQDGLDVDRIVSRRVEVVILRPLVGGLREGEVVNLRLLGGEKDGIRVNAPSDSLYWELETGTTIVFFSTALVEYDDAPAMFTPNHLLVEHGSRFVPAGSSDDQGGLTADEIQELVNSRPAVPPTRP